MNCRVCDSEIILVADLGSTPLADKFPRSAGDKEKMYPLTVAYCSICNSLQADTKLDMAKVFDSDYAFYSGASPSNVKYWQDFADDLIEHFPVQSKGFVIEVASNDGTLLSKFDGTSKRLGIDACENVVDYALEHDINTIEGFWGTDLAETITSSVGKADIIIANNVLAHVEDPHDFIEGVSNALALDGIFVFEFQYVVDLAGQMAWDNIYHEHRSFFSKQTIENLLSVHGLEAQAYKHTPPHSGSLRVIAKKPAGKAVLPAGWLKFDTDEPQLLALLGNMQSRIVYNANALTTLIDRFIGEGKVVAGYGASAKSCTLLNATGIKLPYIVDLTPHKVGRYSPGMKIPIISPKEEEARFGKPDVYLLLVWNYAESVLLREREFMSKGGQFIIPIPYPVVV